MIREGKNTIGNNRHNITGTAIAVLVFILYIIAIMLFVIMPFVALNWAASPFPGFVVEQTLVVSDVSSPAWAGYSLGMAYPQLLIQLGDDPVHSAAEYQAAMENYSFGQVISVKTRLPDGSEYNLKGIPFEAFPAADLARLFFLPYLIGIAYLILGLWVFSQRWRTSPGRAFAYTCVWAAMANVLLFDLYSTHLMTAVWSVAVSQIGGAFIYLSLLFPAEIPLVRRYPVLLLLPVAGSIGLMIWGLEVVYSNSSPWAYIYVWRYSYVYAGLGIAFFIGMMYYRSRRSKEPILQQQVRTTLWGGLFSFLPIGLFFLGPLVNLQILWNPLIFLPLLLIFPASIGVAILRYRLWDIDSIINRTLVYGILTGLLILVYAVCVIVVEKIFSGLVEIQNTAAGAAATLVIVALFDPLRRRLQVFIDRRFFRYKYDVTRTLARFSEVVRDEVNLDHLKSNLIGVIQETMSPNQVTLLNCLVPEPSTVARCLENDPLHDYLIENKEAILLERAPLKSLLVQELIDSGVQMVVPLVHQNELLGIIHLGARRDEKTYTREDRSLLTMLASQTAPALRVSYLVQRQQTEALERDRVEQEMKLARLIQQTLLSRQPPQITGWKISAHYQPARAVGGDFYDFMDLGDGRLVVVIGDVTDKGVPAALIMATTRSVLRGAARRMLPPQAALERSNNILVPEMLPNMFVTCFYAIIELDTGRIQFANAGHNPPYHNGKDGVKELYATGMPLGLMEGVVYEEKEAVLECGESLLLYSDGITEAHNPQREMFDNDRLKALILEKDGGPGIIPQLIEEVKMFTGENADQEDDITLMYLKREG